VSSWLFWELALAGSIIFVLVVMQCETKNRSLFSLIKVKSFQHSLNAQGEALNDVALIDAQADI
jgi:hypothetical protein